MERKSGRDAGDMGRNLTDELLEVTDADDIGLVEHVEPDKDRRDERGHAIRKELPLVYQPRTLSQHELDGPESSRRTTRI